MNSYYEGIQDACLKANNVNLEVVKCPHKLNSEISWKVENGQIKYAGTHCLFYDATSDSAAKLKTCDESIDSFVSVIPYRTAPYGPEPYDYLGLSDIFPTR